MGGSYLSDSKAPDSGFLHGSLRNLCFFKKKKKKEFKYNYFPLVAQTLKTVCNAGDPGSILGQEDPLEKEMAPHSSILAWRIPWIEEPRGLQSVGSQSDMTERLTL